MQGFVVDHLPGFLDGMQGVKGSTRLLVIDRGNEVHRVVTCSTSLSRSERFRNVVRVSHGRRRAGSVSARWRATASGPGRA
jgi:hypothetical protein